MAQRVESACNVGGPGWEDPLEKEMATHSSLLAWRIPTDRGAQWAIVHGVSKSRTQLNDFTSLLKLSGGVSHDQFHIFIV